MCSLAVLTQKARLALFDKVGAIEVRVNSARNLLSWRGDPVRLLQELRAMRDLAESGAALLLQDMPELANHKPPEEAHGVAGPDGEPS